MDVNNIYLVLVLALATSVISVTITEAFVFAKLRLFLTKRNKFIGELFSCFYCFSHWVAFVLVLIYKPTLVKNVPFIDFFITSFVIVALSTLIVGLQWQERTGITDNGDEK